MSRLLSAFLATCTTILFAASAGAQTHTSTAGVDFKSERLQKELEGWEGGQRGAEDVFDAPFEPAASPPAGPGAPRTGAPPAPGAPRGIGSTSAAPSPRQGLQPVPDAGAQTTPKLDPDLLAKGESQKTIGRNLLIGGITGAVIGSIAGVAGWARLLASIDASGGGGTPGDVVLFLGGAALGVAGGALVVAGSIMFHRGGKKMDKARGVKVTHIAPIVHGDTRGAVVGFSF